MIAHSHPGTSVCNSICGVDTPHPQHTREVTNNLLLGSPSHCKHEAGSVLYYPGEAWVATQSLSKNHYDSRESGVQDGDTVTSCSRSRKRHELSFSVRGDSFGAQRRGSQPPLRRHHHGHRHHLSQLCPWCWDTHTHTQQNSTPSSCWGQGWAHSCHLRPKSTDEVWATSVLRVSVHPTRLRGTVWLLFWNASEQSVVLLTGTGLVKC